MNVFGVVGWKNSGKTTLVSGIVSELVSRGHKVATVKHAHHTFDVDHPNTDSFKHRQSGASQVAIVSGKRIALMQELQDETEPTLEEILGRMMPCDFVIVEGYKRSGFPKMEAISAQSIKRDEDLWQSDEKIIAIASDIVREGCEHPRFDPSNYSVIVDFVEEHALFFDRMGSF